MLAIGINKHICPYIYLLNTFKYLLLPAAKWRLGFLLNPPRERGLQKQLPFLFQVHLENHRYGPCILSLFHTKHNIYAAQRT